MPNTNTADISSAYSPIVTRVLAYIREQKRPVSTDEIQAKFDYERKEMNCVRRELQKQEERGGAIRKIVTPCVTTVMFVEGDTEVDKALQLVSHSATTGSAKAID